MNIFRDRLAPARIYLVVVFGLGIAAFRDIVILGLEVGQSFGNYSFRWTILIAAIAAITLLALSALVVVSTPLAGKLSDWVSRIQAFLQRLKIINWLAVLTIWCVYVVVVFSRFEYHFNHPNGRAWFFIVASGVGAVFLSAVKPRWGLLKSLLSVAVLYCVGLTALSYLPMVNNYPFSLGWSEASRYYYASLPYSQRLYGIEIPLSFLHPSRYLMLGLPYLVGDLPLWIHRLWQSVLWIGMSGLGGMVFARRLRLTEQHFFWVFSGWSLLFLLQGPVYYHLMVCVILMLWGFDLRKPKKTWFFLILASIWAGISRINWVPVPALMAISLYLIEKPVSAERNAWRYMLPGVAWGVVGVLTALLSQAAYIPLSGHEDISKFGSSFTADLLWYRLLPNPTYPMGVLPAGILVTLGPIILIAVNWLRGRRDWHILRVVGLIVTMLVLFIGGLVVSTKIGGGSNIHNLDAFMVIVWVAAGSIGLGRFASEQGESPGLPWRPWLMVALIVAITILWSLDIGKPFREPNYAQAQIDLARLQQVVQQHVEADEEILFITQRQLVIFHQVPGVKMVPEYELLTLMEMAMSNNQPYLQSFYSDLRQHRFPLIIADRQQKNFRDPEIDGFAEENNAWVEKVSTPLLENYRSILHLEVPGVDLLVPR